MFVPWSRRYQPGQGGFRPTFCPAARDICFRSAGQSVLLLEPLQAPRTRLHRVSPVPSLKPTTPTSCATGSRSTLRVWESVSHRSTVSTAPSQVSAKASPRMCPRYPACSARSRGPWPSGLTCVVKPRRCICNAWRRAILVRATERRRTGSRSSWRRARSLSTIGPTGSSAAIPTRGKTVDAATAMPVARIVLRCIGVSDRPGEGKPRHVDCQASSIIIAIQVCTSIPNENGGPEGPPCPSSFGMAYAF
jgi:hypothetical protein